MLSLVVVSKETTTKKKKKRLPPGPKGLPIVGHLHLISKNNPHRDFHKLSQIHGPVMHLRFGSVDNIVVSSPGAAERFLKTHDLNFATRPPMEMIKHLTYGQKDLVFGQYGELWREMRKLFTVQLLTSHKINLHESTRREELCLLVDSLKQSARRGEAVDLSAKVASMSGNMSCRMLFGKKYEEKDMVDKEGGLKAVFSEVVRVGGIPNLGDFFPFLGALDVQGLGQRMKAAAKLLDQFLEKIIDEHEHPAAAPPPMLEDIVHIILRIMNNKETSFPFTREHVKSMMVDLLVASIDTSSTAIEWIMSELIKNPTMMLKLKKELERQVGPERMVAEKDLEGLKYLEMVIKETFRFHPVGPFLLPHAAMEDCTVDDFHVPKNARVIISLWAIGRDPDVWSDPERFNPERFDGSNIDYRGQNFELLPFGSGRRGCPGLQLGITAVRLVVAQLVHCFDWSLPNGAPLEDLDMTEEFGLVMSRAQSLMAVPTYKLYT
ncbi:unnamed protein product [Cuscuta campestris]|uniref:Cytochrome P450 n=1 Tax=Cuscuta campestris TaxID=132261 RepID=A0A484KDL6_9ASTE|nr:unnamed protein product [Cuscuta campestris]